LYKAGVIHLPPFDAEDAFGVRRWSGLPPFTPFLCSFGWDLITGVLQFGESVV